MKLSDVTKQKGFKDATIHQIYPDLFVCESNLEGAKRYKRKLIQSKIVIDLPLIDSTFQKNAKHWEDGDKYFNFYTMRSFEFI